MVSNKKPEDVYSLCNVDLRDFKQDYSSQTAGKKMTWFKSNRKTWYKRHPLKNKMNIKICEEI